MTGMGHDGGHSRSFRREKKECPPPALAGIRVLDLSRVLAGPFCTMILGDLGAEVIKVERPGEGDDTRHWGPPFALGESAYYLCANRNKKSITVDVKTGKGRALVRGLAEKSDILIENFRVGAMAKIGLDYEGVREINPGIIYCSISGFGQTGPLKDLPGYDFILQAMSGLMSFTGERDGEPMKMGVAIVDLMAGLYAAIAILAAIREREKSGQGQFIDLSLLDAAVAMLANVGSGFLVSGENPERHGNAHPNIVPYQVFRARDRYIAVGVGNDKQWRRLCEIAERPDLAADPRFATNPERVRNRAALIPILAAVFASRESGFWIRELWREGIPAGPINAMDKVFGDPQTRARGMEVTMDHPSIGTVSLIGSPLKFSRTPVRYLLHPPCLGEHTALVLKDLLGLTDGEIGRLSEEGVI